MKTVQRYPKSLAVLSQTSSMRTTLGESDRVSLRRNLHQCVVRFLVQQRQATDGLQAIGVQFVDVPFLEAGDLEPDRLAIGCDGGALDGGRRVVDFGAAVAGLENEV